MCRKFDPLVLKLDYVVLLIVCLAIRIYHIDTIDLWGDEIHHFFNLHDIGRINEMLLNVRKTALYAAVNIGYKWILPKDLLYSYNFIPRIPALVFGALSVVILYDAFKRYVGNIPAYIVGCLSCASYPLIIFAIRSRVYSMTHFFLAVYIWLYLSMMKEITHKKLVVFLISALFGFFTYPYLAFSIYGFYACMGLFIFKGEFSTRKFFIATSAIFILVSLTFLVITQATFSHPIYETIPLSSSFFIYALKGMLSYYSGNSYLFIGIAFVLPLMNFYNTMKGRADLNYVYLLWMFCSTLIVMHILIVTHTGNAFNPRHVTHLAVPFIACLSLAIYEIHQYGERYTVKTKVYSHFTVCFLAFVTILAFSTRDFRYYLETGINYHGGSNRYSTDLVFLNDTIRQYGENRLLIISPKREENHIFYFYRSRKHVVTPQDLNDDRAILNAHEDSIFIGFVYFKEKDINRLSVRFGDQFKIIKNNRITLFISNKKIKKGHVVEAIKTYLKDS